jgi:hypothetical protein
VTVATDKAVIPAFRSAYQALLYVQLWVENPLCATALSFVQAPGCRRGIASATALRRPAQAAGGRKAFSICWHAAASTPFSL